MLRKHTIQFSHPPTQILKATQSVITNGQLIERVESTRFLGVLVDSKLNFRQHISHIREKVAKDICFGACEDLEILS